MLPYPHRWLGVLSSGSLPPSPRSSPAAPPPTPWLTGNPVSSRPQRFREPPLLLLLQRIAPRTALSAPSPIKRPQVPPLPPRLPRFPTKPSFPDCKSSSPLNLSRTPARLGK